MDRIEDTLELLETRERVVDEAFVEEGMAARLVRAAPEGTTEILLQVAFCRPNREPMVIQLRMARDQGLPLAKGHPFRRREIPEKEG